MSASTLGAPAPLPDAPGALGASRLVGLLRLLSRGAALLLLLLLGASLLGWSRGPLLALALVGLPLTLAPSWLLLGFGVRLRDRALVLLSVPLVLAHVLVLGLALLPAAPPERSGGAVAGSSVALRVVSANALYSNDSNAALAGALLRARPDVLVVSELTPALLGEFEAVGLLRALPFDTLGSRPGETEIFSRFPLSGHSRVLAHPDHSQPRAVAQLPGLELALVGTHPLPPVGCCEREGREALRSLASEVSGVALPVVVAGDFNADRHQPLFDDLLRLGLRDAAEERGRGLAGTWPSRFPLLQLDHVLVRDGRGARVFVRASSNLELPGSDHEGVVADLLVVGSR